MKKINQWMLTRYPLLWNTRVYIVLPVLILIHLLFYLGGFSKDYSLDNLSYADTRLDKETTWFAVLAGIIFVITWLTYYFRNNAFKSFYPLKRGSLVVEYFIILLACFGAATFTFSFKKGMHDKIFSIGSGTDLQKEAYVVNMALHFIPFDYDAFDVNSTCEDTEEHKEYPKEEAIVEAVPDSAPPSLHSYLNYCRMHVSADDYNSYAYNRIARRWLLGNKQDSVKWVLTEYLKLCDKYGAAYRFSAERQAEECFSTPGFTVRTRVYEDDNDLSAGSEYIAHYKVTNALSTLHYVHNKTWDKWENLGYLYFIVSLSLMIFSFRLTRLRTWFIALIGTGIWVVFFVILLVSSRGMEKTAPFIFFFILALFFLVFALWGIFSKKMKLQSGLCLLWFSWLLPSLMPVIFAYIQVRSSIYYLKHYDKTLQQTETYNWINEHWVSINGYNLVFVVLMILVMFIPLARKWQANPEE